MNKGTNLKMNEDNMRYHSMILKDDHLIVTEGSKIFDINLTDKSKTCLIEKDGFNYLGEKNSYDDIFLTTASDRYRDFIVTIEKKY